MIRRTKIALRAQPTNRRRAATLMELLIATSIMLFVTVPMMYSMIFVLRAQATIAAQTRARIEAKIAVNRMVNDIQRTSSELYNAANWTGVETVTDGSDVVRVLRLFDAIRGERIEWEYNETTENLTRTTFDAVSGSQVHQHNLIGRFANLEWEEVLFREFDSLEEDDSDLTDLTVTAITIRARMFPRLQPPHTVYREFDGNGDGDYEDDATGELLFGLEDLGDDPGWQYVVNISSGFRNG
ncbi:MAG: hypothetical protein RLY93_07660 [Sumerlaeia bacterium]